MTNDKLVSYVTDELYWDPKVDNAAIAVSADDGEITLRGTVGSFREKREAKHAAERVYGVTSVKSELTVAPLTEKRREDADLRGDVLRALVLNSLVPETIDARVSDGFITLTGTADWQYQRDEAELMASNIVGTLDVLDEIALKTRPHAADIKDRIDAAFKRNARLDADHLSVTTLNGTVTVTGPVRSWAEHDEALDAAWSAPGVSHVDDHILIRY
jgi:osmotically-inducible protein OsmY